MGIALACIQAANEASTTEQRPLFTRQSVRTGDRHQKPPLSRCATPVTFRTCVWALLCFFFPAPQRQLHCWFPSHLRITFTFTNLHFNMFCRTCNAAWVTLTVHLIEKEYRGGCWVVTAQSLLNPSYIITNLNIVVNVFFFGLTSFFVVEVWGLAGRQLAFLAFSSLVNFRPYQTVNVFAMSDWKWVNEVVYAIIPRAAAVCEKCLHA